MCEKYRTLKSLMGRHRSWRRIAKKERRRRIRTQLAKERDSGMGNNPVDLEIEEWSKEQEALELFEMEQIDKTNKEENDKWLKAEKKAMEQWKMIQDKKEKMRLQRLKEEAKLQMEWEEEQKRKKFEKERLKEIEEGNKKKQEIFMKNLEKFLAGDSVEPPSELLISRDTKPNSEFCPFFTKTACCRFGDQCSRNHRYPGISTVVLATNFYSHFGLEYANEFDTDIMLEYEDSETYKEYKEFFYDVIPEFEKFGRLTQFRVCNNYEKHLRGNMYVEFAELRCAVAAYRSLHTRWYGGKQLSLQFCLINSWKNAICGLQSRKRCPKGRACNFLHVFRNPNNLFSSYFTSQHQDSERSRRTPPRTWRWSESPEVELPRRRRSRSRSKERKFRRRENKDRRESSDHDSEYYRKKHDKRNSRRKSSERNRRSDRRNS